MITPFNRFSSATTDFFSSKRHNWKSSWKSRKKIYGQIYGQKFSVLLHPLSNIEINNYFSYEPRFNGVFSRNDLPKIKDGAFVINLDDKKSKGTPWSSLFIDKNTALYFDSFGIDHIPQKVLNKIRDKCIAFIESMLAGETLFDYTNLFSLNDYKKSGKILCKYFKDIYGRTSRS